MKETSTVTDTFYFVLSKKDLESRKNDANGHRFEHDCICPDENFVLIHTQAHASTVCFAIPGETSLRSLTISNIMLRQDLLVLLRMSYTGSTSL